MTTVYMVVIVCTVCIVYMVCMTESTTERLSPEPVEDENRANFADAYRPHTFKKVFGQDSVVACLSGLIARGRIGRSILLHGAVGSGKTTLARIYARALNCEAPDPRASPCYACEACGRLGEKPIKEFEEYNVSRRGGGREDVERFLSTHDRPVHGAKYRILFFDEAHALTREACDLLLLPVESPQHAIRFIFATTEAERLRRALRSRLLDLLIRPLPVDRAIEFLRQAAEKIGIAHEPGALALLAGLREGYPRDLLLGLERVWERNTPRLTVAQVRAAFDVDQTEVLVAYFTALADGDPDQQAEIVFGWQEQATDKIRWIQAFLLHVYHNEILARRLVVDGVIEAVPENLRAGIVRGFCARLGLADARDLAPFWRQMMAFWPVPETATDETALGLRLTLFHQLVNAGVEGEAVAAERARPTDAAAAIAQASTIAEASRGFGPPPLLRPGARVVADKAGFLTPADVRRIVNSASFLVQEHGLLFNTAFAITPAALGVSGTASAVAAITAFRDELAAQARAWGGGLRAGITVLERDHRGVIGRIVAHLHAPNPLDPADADGARRTEAWVKAWREGAGRLGGDAVEFAPAPVGERAALRFHWRRSLDLCAGLDERVEAFDPRIAEHRSLLELLRVRARSARPVLDHPLVATSASLSDEQVAQACRNRLEPLSAYDDEAWEELTTGWELEEFQVRRDTRAKREGRLAEIRQQFGEATPEARAEIAQTVGGWPSDPRRRPRRWRRERAGEPWP